VTGAIAARVVAAAGGEMDNKMHFFYFTKRAERLFFLYDPG
jgi:hypothetical protein